MKISLYVLALLCLTIDELPAGSLFERNLSAAGKDTYALQATGRSFLNVTVEQRGVDIGLRLIGRDGQVLKEINRSAGTRGTETLKSIVDAGFKLEVIAVNAMASGGSYSLKVLALCSPDSKQEIEVALEDIFEKASSLRRANRVDEAIKTLSEALSRAVEVLGEEHLSSAECMNNLAMLYKDRGDYKQAEPLYRRALEIREKLLGADSPVVADSLNNLAIELQATGEMDEAELLHRRALAIR